MPLVSVSLLVLELLVVVQYRSGVRLFACWINWCITNNISASLTSIPAANIVGTVCTISGANLTGGFGKITMADQWLYINGIQLIQTKCLISYI